MPVHLPVAPPTYDQGDQARMRGAIEQAHIKDFAPGPAQSGPLLVALDDPRLKAAGYAAIANGAAASLHMIGEDGQPDSRIEARVEVKDGQLAFLPQRSAAQRKLLAKLGLG